MKTINLNSQGTKGSKWTITPVPGILDVAIITNNTTGQKYTYHLSRPVNVITDQKTGKQTWNGNPSIPVPIVRETRLSLIKRLNLSKQLRSA